MEAGYREDDMEQDSTEWMTPGALAKVRYVIEQTHDTLLDRAELEDGDQRLGSINMEEFVGAVRAQVPGPVMPDEGLRFLIETYVSGLANDAFPKVYAANDIVCLIPTPCNERGDLFVENQPGRFAHLHIMIVDHKMKRRVAGWPGKKSPLYQFLPREMQNDMSFTVPVGSTPEQVAELLTRAYKNGQFYFDQAGAQEQVQ
jgi:hypothetical protein